MPQGGNIALVTYSGTQAIMSMDAAEEEGLALARLQGKTRGSLSRVVASPSKTQNPVDMFPDVMVHGLEKATTEIFHALLKDNGVHGIAFISFARSRGESFVPLVEVIEKYAKKPVFFPWSAPEKS